jgi:hypothetical protein
LTPLLFAAALLGTLAGCPDPLDYQPADLQVDLPDQVPAEAEHVQVCAVSERLCCFGARLSGNFAMVGLPPEGAMDIVVDVYDAEGELLLQGSASAVDGYAVGEVTDCSDGGCTPCGPEELPGSYYSCPPPDDCTPNDPNDAGVCTCETWPGAARQGGDTRNLAVHFTE